MKELIDMGSGFYSDMKPILIGILSVLTRITLLLASILPVLIVILLFPIGKGTVPIGIILILTTKTSKQLLL